MALYLDEREKIQSGDLLIWSQEKLETLSDLIPYIVRFFTMSDYNHVGIAWKVEGRLFVIEATLPEIRIHPVSKRRPFYYIPMGVKMDDKGLNYLLNLIGKDYSIRQAVLALFGKSLKDEYICTELAKEFYNLYGVDVGEDLTPGGMVHNILSIHDTDLIHVK